MKSRWVVGLALLSGVGVGLGALAVGAVPIPGGFWNAFVAPGIGRDILFDIRLPRILLAGAVGALLSSAGCALQGLLRQAQDPLLETQRSGGDEFVGAVIDHALTDMAWAPSDNPDNRRLLFVAGNETAGLGPVHFRDAARRAVGQRVIVNTLFAGTRSAGEALRWAEVASAGNGRFMAIDAEISAVAVATPYDAQLEQLNSRLNGTYVSYDRAGAAKVAPGPVVGGVVVPEVVGLAQHAGRRGPKRGDGR